VLPLKKTKRVDKWISYLTIYSNSENNGEQLNFKIWDASKGLILIANVDNKSSIPYERKWSIRQTKPTGDFRKL
jgi:hypothetical protein